MTSSQSICFETINSNDVNRSGPWTASEDARLIQVVNKYGARSWDKLATKIPGRSGKSCRLRWSNQLSPDLNRAPFSDWEDAVVIRGHEELGKKWAKISKLLVGRTDNAVKNRWNGLFCRGLENVTKKNIYLSSRATLRAILNAGPTCNPVRWQQRRDNEQQAVLKSESCQSHETYQPRARHHQQGQYKRDWIGGCSAARDNTGGPDASAADSSVNSFASLKDEASLLTYEESPVAARRPNKDKNNVDFISTDDDDQHAGSHHHGAQHEDVGMNENGNDGVIPEFQNTISDDNEIYNQQEAMMIYFDRHQQQQQPPEQFNHYGTKYQLHIASFRFHAFPRLTKSNASSESDEMPSAEGLRSGFIGVKHGWIDATPFSSDLDDHIREFFMGAECSSSR